MRSVGVLKVKVWKLGGNHQHCENSWRHRSNTQNFKSDTNFGRKPCKVDHAHKHCDDRIPGIWLSGWHSCHHLCVTTYVWQQRGSGLVIAQQFVDRGKSNTKTGRGWGRGGCETGSRSRRPSTGQPLGWSPDQRTHRETLIPVNVMGNIPALTY